MERELYDKMSVVIENNELIDVINDVYFYKYNERVYSFTEEEIQEYVVHKWMEFSIIKQ